VPAKEHHTPFAHEPMQSLCEFTTALSVHISARRQWRITSGSATQWFLVLRKISIAQTEITRTHQKPLSDHFNFPFNKRERRCAACYAQAPLLMVAV